MFVLYFMWSIWLTCLDPSYKGKIGMTFFYDNNYFAMCVNAFNVWYILVRYKRKVEVQTEMHVKYFNIKCAMT